MSDEDRMRSEIARMQMSGDELTDEVHVLQFIDYMSPCQWMNILGSLMALF